MGGLAFTIQLDMPSKTVPVTWEDLRIQPLLCLRYACTAESSSSDLDFLRQHWSSFIRHVVPTIIRHLTHIFDDAGRAVLIPDELLLLMVRLRCNDVLQVALGEDVVMMPESEGGRQEVVSHT